MPTYVKCDGQSALVDKALFNPESNKIHLLSMLGSREATRAVWAMGVQGKPLMLELEGKWRALSFAEMTMKHEKLPCGRRHMLVVSKETYASRVVVGRSLEEVEDRVWAKVTRIARVPLHQSWKAWTLEHLNLTRLEGLGGIFGVVLSGVDELERQVCEEIKAGMLCV